MKTKEISVNIPTIGEVLFTADVEIVNNGIGCYEHCGAKRVDKHYEPEIQKMCWNEKLYNDEQNAFILNYITDEYEVVDNIMLKDFKYTDEDI